jgi:hypothetical protein
MAAQNDLTGAEIDTLYKLADHFPGVVEAGDIPSKVGCAGLVRRGLAAWMSGGSAVCIDAGMREYIRRASTRIKGPKEKR